MKSVVYFNIRVAKEGLNYGILSSEMGSSGESYAAMESYESDKRHDSNPPKENETA
jgi:hypothetical protein